MLTPGLLSGGCPVARALMRRLSGLCLVTLLWVRRCSMSRCSTMPLSIGWRTGRLCVAVGGRRPRAPRLIRLRCCVLRSRSRCGPCGAESRRVSRWLRGLRGTGAPLGYGRVPLRAGSALRAHSSPRACPCSSPCACPPSSPCRCRSRPTADGRGHPAGTAADTAAVLVNRWATAAGPESRWATAAGRERLGGRPVPACRDGRPVPACCDDRLVPGGRCPRAPTRTRPLGSTAVPAGLVPLSPPDPARGRVSALTSGGSSSSCSSLSGTSSGESEWARRRRVPPFSPAAPAGRD